MSEVTWRKRIVVMVMAAILSLTGASVTAAAVADESALAAARDRANGGDD